MRLTLLRCTKPGSWHVSPAPAAHTHCLAPPQQLSKPGLWHVSPSLQLIRTPWHPSVRLARTRTWPSAPPIPRAAAPSSFGRNAGAFQWWETGPESSCTYMLSKYARGRRITRHVAWARTSSALPSPVSGSRCALLLVFATTARSPRLAEPCHLRTHCVAPSLWPRSTSACVRSPCLSRPPVPSWVTVSLSGSSKKATVLRRRRIFFRKYLQKENCTQLRLVSLNTCVY